MSLSLYLGILQKNRISVDSSPSAGIFGGHTTKTRGVFFGNHGRIENKKKEEGKTSSIRLASAAWL